MAGISRREWKSSAPAKGEWKEHELLGDCLGGAAWKVGPPAAFLEEMCLWVQAARCQLSQVHTPCRWWDRGMPSLGNGEDGGTQLGMTLVFAVLQLAMLCESCLFKYWLMRLLGTLNYLRNIMLL